MPLLSHLVGLAIGGALIALVFYVIYWTFKQIPFPPPWGVIVNVLIGIAALVALLAAAQYVLPLARV